MGVIENHKDAEKLATYRKQLSSKSSSLYCHGFQRPSEVLHEVATWCEQNAVDFEAYGKGDLLQQFERKIADLLGFPAARFMPSGTLAQLVALRIWSDQSGCNNFAMHPSSHLELHEELGYSYLHGLTATLIGPKKSPILVEHLEQVSEQLSTLILELPMREVGGQLPSWEELEAIKLQARSRGIRLHLDGARLWECKSFYNKKYSEICAGFDSVYVSFYKGIGALPGAMLLGSQDFIDQSKLWQRRAGGTLQTLVSNVASANMKFDQSLLRFPSYFQKTVGLISAIESIDGLRIVPPKPQVNMVHIYLPFSTDAAEAARDQIAEEYSVWMFGNASTGDSPNSSYFELYVGDSAMMLRDELLVNLFERLIEVGRNLAV